MAKEKKLKEIKPPKEPKGSIIDYLSWLTDKKRKWEELSFEEKKNFNLYIVNRFLSMDLYFCEAINTLQKYTLSNMPKEIVWRLYYEILPTQRSYAKFIKATKIEGVDEKDITAVKKYFNCPEVQAIEYINLLKAKGLEKEIEIIKQNYIYE